MLPGWFVALSPYLSQWEHPGAEVPVEQPVHVHSHRCRPACPQARFPLVPAATGPGGLVRMSGSARNSSLGSYGERVAAQRLVDQGMVLVDRNWRCELGEVDLVLRDGDVLVFCEVKTRTSAAYGHPLEAVGPGEGRAAATAGDALGRGARRPPGRHPDRPGRGAARRARGSRGRARAGGRLMVATTHTVSLQGAVGHVVDVQVDLSDGLIGTALVGRPDTSITEARDRCRAAVKNSLFTWPNTRRITILLSPADLPKRGPHFDLAIAVAVLAAADKDFPHDSLDGAAMIGELTLDGRLRCVPGVLPMTMAAAARGIETVYVPEPQTAEAAMVPGHAGLRDPVAGAGGRAAEGRRGVPRGSGGRADVGLAAAHLARRGAAGGPRHGRRDRDGRHALRHRGRGGRGPPPDAHRPQGVGQDHARRAHPRAAARPHRRRVPRAHRGALAVRRAPGRRLTAHPAAVPRAAPLGLAHRASSAAAAAGCAPARSARPISGCSSSTSSRCSPPTSSRPCASRWRPVRSRSRGARRTPPTRRGRCSCSRATRADAGSTTPTPATTTAPARR